MRHTLIALLLTCVVQSSAAAADMEVIAQRVLDSQVPLAEREALIASNLFDGVPLLKAITSNVPTEGPEEYRRIPWIWRVAVAIGKRNDANQIREMLNASLPQDDQSLRHWQAVVIGGGIINGLGLQGIWPGDRISEILDGNEKLAGRWNRSLELATVMADDEKVPTGTRYDALRMVALLPSNRAAEQLVRYLEKGIHDELQQGAISGLSDMKSAPLAELFLPRITQFSSSNRNFAIQALLRDEQRRATLKEALKNGKGNGLPREILARLNVRTDENTSFP